MGRGTIGGADGGGVKRRGEMKGSLNGTIIKARELRRTMSLPEGLLWQELRKRPSGFKFRRQHPIGPYIGDFFCPAARLVVEVDGAAHEMGERPAHDAARDRRLAELKVRTLRVPAAEVLRDTAAVVQGIVAACAR